MSDGNAIKKLLARIYPLGSAACRRLFVCLFFFFSFFYFGHNKSIDIKTATCLRVSTCVHGRAATLHRNLDVLSVRYVCVRREERNNIIFVNFAAINVETLLQYRFIYFVVK